MQTVYTGFTYAALKFFPVDVPNCGLSTNEAMAVIVMVAGLVQNMMAASTNEARTKYGVPWPHTFAPEKNADKLKFDMVQRA